MCRLLGLFSVNDSSAFAPLLETDKCLWRQSFADPRRRQTDGWGLAWHRDGRPLVFKSAGDLARERPLLRRAADRARGRAVLFHVRRASNPRGIDPAGLKGARNVQPFRFGRWSFVHNGSIPFPDSVARTLGPWARRLRGLNDSEVLFWLLMREIRRTGSVPSALVRARRALAAARPAPGSPHGGLNVLLSDGERLWAYAEAPAGFRGGSLLSPERPYFRMAFLPTPDRLWVASEPPWSGAHWRSVGSGELLEARRDGGKIIWCKNKVRTE